MKMRIGMLEYIVEQTRLFLEDKPKIKRKKKGQFFTSIETAKFMSEMFDISSCGDEITVLDPGSGTGILAVAFIDQIISVLQDVHASRRLIHSLPDNTNRRRSAHRDVGAVPPAVHQDGT